MGGSSSREADAEAAETRSLESRLASFGDLPDLRTLFSHLSPSSAPFPLPLLQEYFDLQRITCPPSSELSILSQHVASTLIDIIFEPKDSAISWQAFLKGFEKCYQPAVSGKLKLLLFFYYHVRKKANLSLTFGLTHEVSSFSLQDDLTGNMTVMELQDFLWLCWLMGCDAKTQQDKGGGLELPNVQPLVQSACLACSVSSSDPKTEVLLMEELYKWLHLTIPGLPISLFDYIRARIHRCAAKIQGQGKVPIDSEGQYGPEPNIWQTRNHECDLLSSGVAWAIGLSLSDAIGSKILSCAFSLTEDAAYLLYRSSLHGKGMNRFWVHMEGYRGAVLMLVQGTTQGSEDQMTDNSQEEKWLVGALASEGFENKNRFYGSRGCCIFALDPVMQPFRPIGTGSNFVYAHTHVASSASYLQQQKGPGGIAFGGDIGRERLFLDEDFMYLTVRHHAVDKTYEPGHLLPNQGYAAIKARVLDVEVWGLGGTSMRERQAKFQDRKNLFVEQKRKVDLQSFGNWADSPEKMMMDMVSDPNRVQRQER